MIRLRYRPVDGHLSAIGVLAPLGFLVTAIGLVTSFSAPFLPLFLSRELRASPGLVSLFLFLTPLAAVVTETAIARISDRPAMRRRLLILAASVGCVGFALVGLLRYYWVALAVSLTLLAVASSLVPQVFAVSRESLERSHPARATTGMSVLRSLFSVAWVAGPPLAALLIGSIEFRGLYIVVALLHVAMLPVFLGLRDSRRADGGAGAGARSAAEPTAPPVDPSRRRLLRISAGFVLLTCAMNLGVMSMPLLVSVDLGGKVSGAGLILGLCAALEIPFILLFGVLTSRWALHHLVVFGAAIGIGYFGLMTVAGGVGTIAAFQILNACFIAAIGGLGISYFQDLMPTRLGGATTLYTNTFRVGTMLAGLIFGVGQLAGYRFSYLIAAVLCAGGLALLVPGSRRVPSPMARSTGTRTDTDQLTVPRPA